MVLFDPAIFDVPRIFDGAAPVVTPPYIAPVQHWVARKRILTVEDPLFIVTLIRRIRRKRNAE